MGKIIGIILLLILLIGCGIFYCQFCSAVGSWLALIVCVASGVVFTLIGVIWRAIRRKRAAHPVFTAAQQQKLALAAKEDKKNESENARTLAADLLKWQEYRKGRVVEIDKEIQTYASQAAGWFANLKEHRSKLAAMDALGEDDKNMQTIEWLQYFINTRRADSIKEALHEYDKAVANQQLLTMEQQRIAVQQQLAQQQLAQAQANHEERLRQDREHQREMEIAARDNAAARDKIARDLETLSQNYWYNTYKSN